LIGCEGGVSGWWCAKKRFVFGFFVSFRWASLWLGQWNACLIRTRTIEATELAGAGAFVVCAFYTRASKPARGRVCFLIKKGGSELVFCFCFCVVVVWVPSTVRTESVCASASAGVGVYFCPLPRIPSLFSTSGAGAARIERILLPTYSFVVLLFRWDSAPTRRGCSVVLRATRSS